MSYTVKRSAACGKCGEMTNRRERGSCMPLCIACALQKATDNMIQMRQHSGPYYDKWRARMMRTFSR